MKNVSFCSAFWPVYIYIYIYMSPVNFIVERDAPWIMSSTVKHWLVILSCLKISHKAICYPDFSLMV